MLVCLIFHLTTIVYFRDLCKNLLIIANMVPLPSFSFSPVITNSTVNISPSCLSKFWSVLIWFQCDSSDSNIKMLVLISCTLENVTLLCSLHFANLMDEILHYFSLISISLIITRQISSSLVNCKIVLFSVAYMEKLAFIETK